MTLDESKTIIERDLNCLKQNKALPDSVKAMEIAIKALEEVQQYRAIGTVEKIKEELNRLRNDNECQGLYFTFEERQDLARQHRELEEYHAIGTPEECRAAVEKQTAKKVKIEQWIYTKCDCGYEFSTHHGDGYYSIPYERKTKYCPDCGHKLDWGDVE